MSSRAVYKTNLSDRECLIEALNDLCGPSNVKVHGKDTISARYQGRLASFGRVKEDANYDVTVAERGVPSELSGSIFPNTDSNGNTVYKLGQAYSKAMVMRAMRAIRGNVVQDDTETNGTQHIRVRVVSFDE